MIESPDGNERDLLVRLGNELADVYGEMLDTPLPGRLATLVERFEGSERGAAAGQMRPDVAPRDF